MFAHREKDAHPPSETNGLAADSNMTPIASTSLAPDISIQFRKSRDSLPSPPLPLALVNGSDLDSVPGASSTLRKIPDGHPTLQEASPGSAMSAKASRHLGPVADLPSEELTGGIINNSYRLEDDAGGLGRVAAGIGMAMTADTETEMEDDHEAYADGEIDPTLVEIVQSLKKAQEAAQGVRLSLVQSCFFRRLKQWLVVENSHRDGLLDTDVRKTKAPQV